MFSIENEDEFLAGARPVLKEHGPYTYNLYRVRETNSWSEESVRFFETFEMNWNAEQSLPLDKELRVINIPLFGSFLVVEKILKDLFLGFIGQIVKPIVTAALRVSGETLIETRTVKELLEGRKIRILELIESILQPLRDRGLPIPALGLGGFTIQNSEFGFCGMISGIRLGPFEAYRRTNAYDQITAHYHSFKDKR